MLINKQYTGGHKKATHIAKGINIKQKQAARIYLIKIKGATS
jgi:hypothetical protein